MIDRTDRQADRKRARYSH